LKQKAAFPGAGLRREEPFAVLLERPSLTESDIASPPARSQRARLAWEADPARAGDQVPYGAVWVRLPRFIGDSVMIHQALEPLRAAGIPLVAWGPAPVAELFRGSGAFQGVWADGPDRGMRVLRRLLRAAGAAGVINLPRSTRALLAAWLARVPLRVGWREGSGFLFANRSRPFKGEGHQMERYRRLLEAAFPGLAAVEARPFRPRPEAFAEADRALAGLGVQPPFVALGLGAMTANKRLGTGVWLELIARLRRRGLAHVLLGGPGEDEAQAAAIRAGLGPVPDLAGRTPLAITAAVLARAGVLVGNDSAMSHLAAACGTPVVAVFGPTLPERSGPTGPSVRILRREELPCLGCYRFDCPVPGHPCMEAIAPETLERAVCDALALP